MAARIALLAAALALAGCAGDSDEPSGIPESALPSTVLQLDDLPAPFSQFDEGRQSRAEPTSRFRSDPIRFQRLGGWKARYRRPGSTTTAGPLVIESRADLFTDDEGAHRRSRGVPKGAAAAGRRDRRPRARGACPRRRSRRDHVSRGPASASTGSRGATRTSPRSSSRTGSTGGSSSPRRWRSRASSSGGSSRRPARA